MLLPRTAPIVAPATDFASRLRAPGDRPRGNLSSMSGRELVVMILVMAGLTIGMNYFLPHHKPAAHPAAHPAMTSQP